MSLKQQKLPENKSFGWFFGVILGLAGLYFAYHSLIALATTMFLLSLCFIAIAVIRPKLLMPLNSAWMYLGLLLAKAFNPLILGSIFYILITPIGLIGRLAGRDVLLISGKK